MTREPIWEIAKHIHVEFSMKLGGIRDKKLKSKLIESQSLQISKEAAIFRLITVQFLLFIEN